MTHPTLLRIPSWIGSDVPPDEHVLPLPVGDYEVTESDRWTVCVRATGEVIYQGIGPVDVVVSPAPF